MALSAHGISSAVANAANVFLPVLCRRCARKRDVVRKNDIVPVLRFSRGRQEFSERIAGTCGRGGRSGS